MIFGKSLFMIITYPLLTPAAKVACFPSFSCVKERETYAMPFFFSAYGTTIDSGAIFRGPVGVFS